MNFRIAEYGIKDGPIMSATDPFEIIVTGKGGHAALPEKCIDPIYIASQIVLGIKGIISNNILDTNEKIVLGITSIHGGSSYNLIPDTVKMKGICRTYNNELREKIKEVVQEVSRNIAKAMGASVEFNYPSSLPAVVNSKEEAEMVQKIAENIVGKENVITNYKTMCSEDFSHFLLNRSGAFVFIGCQGEVYYPQHNENFCVRHRTNASRSASFVEYSNRKLIILHKYCK